YADLEETDLVQVRQFSIFNRWGKKVFQTQGLIPNDPTQGWDGTFQGQAVPPGAYTWAADFEREDGLVFTCGGNLLLLR
ncbi:MAG: gliding motility-associated C-terminal domain-containing protein, partial [Bacteroidota bacterium]